MIINTQYSRLYFLGPHYVYHKKSNILKLPDDLLPHLHPDLVRIDLIEQSLILSWYKFQISVEMLFIERKASLTASSCIKLHEIYARARA